MSYWLEDKSGEYLGDLASNMGMKELREAGVDSLREMLEKGMADAYLIERVVEDLKGDTELGYIADMIEGSGTVFVTDGCGTAGPDDEKYFSPSEEKHLPGQHSQQSHGRGGGRVQVDENGRGKMEKDNDGNLSYAGVSEREWMEWLDSGISINAAMAGNLEAGFVGEQGTKFSQEDVDRFKEIGAKIQDAAESNMFEGEVMLYRGESYDSVEEMLAVHKPTGRKKVPLDRMVSTALSEDVAMHYAELAEKPVKVILRFGNRYGIRGVQTAPMGEPSGEVVLPKGDAYNTSRAYLRPDGVYVIDKYTPEKHKGLQRVKVD